MEVHHGFDSLPVFRDPVATVGSFDGVHRGHRELLDRVTARARERGGDSIVLTFSPHPREVLEQDARIGLLTGLKEKELLLGRLGVDHMVVIPFTREFSAIPSGDFIRDYIIGRLGVRLLVAGYNHHFGRDKQGDASGLDPLRRELGFDVDIVARRDVDGAKVSSTVIRRAIGAGELDKAAALLGYPYFMIAMRDETGLVHPVEKGKLLPPPSTYRVYIGPGDGTGRAAGIEIRPDGSISVPPDQFSTGTGEFIIRF